MLYELFGNAPSVYRTLSRLRGYRVHEPDRRIPYEFLGNQYGGWPVPRGALGSQSIVYSFGIGEDVSFELELIRRVGCVVHAFDPTPVALDWIKGQALPVQLNVEQVGLAEFDGTVDFFAPMDRHSFSRSPGRNDSESVRCPVRRLETLAAERGHRHIDLLKMDIEGFEYAVVEDLRQSDVRPSVINVEFHHKSYGYVAGDTMAAVNSLRDLGYDIYWVSDIGREYGFVRR